MKVITIVGARPQFVKAAVVSRAFSKSNVVQEVIIHTGQHFDTNMSDIFFEEMDIPKPTFNLNINGLSHGSMTGQMLEGIEKIIIDEQPDWVLVYGDTNSTIAGALAAKKLHVKVAHVEAGLRSFNMKMPEEVNRIVTDRISDILFCPTDNAVQNLLKEGFESIDTKIIKCGDVMQDAAMYYANKSLKPAFDIPEKYVLCTVHRAENTDDKIKLADIFHALELISKEVPVVLPIHPRTQAKLDAIDYDFGKSNIRFISPVGYLEMVWLLENSSLVVTDSGGLQKEAYFFDKYCITIREETEWVELVENGFNSLAGTDVNKILELFNTFISKDSHGFEQRLYGNGDCGEIIVNELLKYRN